MIAQPLQRETLMHLETRPLHRTLACEVIGLSLWEPLAPDTIAELRELWSRRGVLVFRRQALSETELAHFCALFGPLERTVRTDWASPAVPKSPPAGGETFWVDLRAAYAGLPRNLRQRVTGQRGIFDYAKRLAGYGRARDQKTPGEAGGG